MALLFNRQQRIFRVVQIRQIDRDAINALGSLNVDNAAVLGRVGVKLNRARNDARRGFCARADDGIEFVCASAVFVCSHYFLFRLGCGF